MKTMMFFVFMLCLHSLIAQSNISGKWLGTSTQNEGGFRTTYDFELYLHQDGMQVTGRSYVFIENIYAEMKLIGHVDANDSITLKETKLIDFKEFEGMEWCIKEMFLKLNRSNNILILEGNWIGKTSFSSCTPGKILLKKIVPRA